MQNQLSYYQQMNEQAKNGNQTQTQAQPAN